MSQPEASYKPGDWVRVSTTIWAPEWTTRLVKRLCDGPATTTWKVAPGWPDDGHFAVGGNRIERHATPDEVAKACMAIPKDEL